MNQLRQLMLEELRRRNFADTTIRSYLHGVSHFSRYFRRPQQKRVLMKSWVSCTKIRDEHCQPIDGPGTGAGNNIGVDTVNVSRTDGG